MFVRRVAFEESAHGLVCRGIFVCDEPVFLFSPFGEFPPEKLFVELAYIGRVAGGYLEMDEGV